VARGSVPCSTAEPIPPSPSGAVFSARSFYYLQGFSMSNLILDQLNALAGFVGAALVDSDSGMALAMHGGGNINLELAAAGNTEVVRAKRRVAAQLGLDDTLEDILINPSAASTT